MLTKDILKLPINTDLVVIKHHEYVSKSATSDPWWVDVNGNRSPKISARHVVYAQLVSYDTYEESHYVEPNPTHYGFCKTSSDRTKRFMVTNGTLFWLVNASNIIGLKSEFAPFYDKELADIEAERAELNRRQAIRQAIVTQVESQAESLRQSLKDSLKDLLGIVASENADINLRVLGDYNHDFTNYEGHIEGRVALNYKHLQTLIELAYEGKQ
jgi:hypothetical protein